MADRTLSGIITTYRTRVDWWIWLIYAVVVTIAIANVFYSVWYNALIQGFGLLVWPLIWLLGIKYEIQGDTLSVFQYFRRRSMPIDEISEVRYSRGYTNCIGMSNRRLTITFTDNHRYLQSCLPLEISPLDQDAFVEKLLSINPQINVVRP